MKPEQYEAIIEGILFAMGGSVELTKLSEALELETEEVCEIIHKMMKSRCVPSKSCMNILSGLQSSPNVTY